MIYQSTRGKAHEVSAAGAIVEGLASDGGLYVPQEFPAIPLDVIVGWKNASYHQIAATIMGKYLGGFSAKEVDEMVSAAYGSRFDDDRIVPLVPLNNGEMVLELFHGPTLAFKDMALQMLPHLLVHSLQKNGVREKILILVATSGDTGKAALEGFCDVSDTAIQVFYPEGGVSPAQLRQMNTQRGENVAVTAVKGNFDDTQNGVKGIFSDRDFAKTIAEKGYRFSSANSINWGRLLPQIAYYFGAYAQAMANGRIQAGAPLNFVVPTGNFGNILAGYYAKQMGLPVAKLICASNRNNVLTDFFAKGMYDRKRSFYQTTSPSMDILISSNLERLLFEITGRDCQQVCDWMKALQEKGEYQLSEEQRGKIAADFDAGYASDEDGKACIQQIWEKEGYLLDTHTAVAQCVYEQYRERTGDATPTVLVSTASPFKFAADVLDAIAPEKRAAIDPQDAFEAADALAEMTHTAVPKGIDELRILPVLHKDVVAADDMPAAVLHALTQWK